MKHFRVTLFAFTCIAAGSLFAAPPQAAKPAQNGAESTKGFRAEFIANLNDVQEKILSMAREIPAEKYTWRPGDGVRSMSEVFMHIAGGNYFLATFVGAKAPDDMPSDLEKISDKARVIAELQKSFDHIREVMKKTTESDLDRAIKLFGSDSTYRGVYLTMLNHLHEHLGQQIAYARMNKIVPPWSRNEIAGSR